jgi:hypothetical protein
MKLQVYNLLDQ